MSGKNIKCGDKKKTKKVNFTGTKKYLRYIT